MYCAKLKHTNSNVEPCEKTLCQEPCMLLHPPCHTACTHATLLTVVQGRRTPALVTSTHSFICIMTDTGELVLMSFFLSPEGRGEVRL